MDATQICSYLDADLVTFIHNIIVVIKIAVPIILVIFGMLDLAKGVVAGKEDEIKKGQQVFIKRLIAAALVFFVITIVQLVMGLISSEDNSFWNCADQILNGTAGTKYEPTGVTGKEKTSTNNENNNSNNSINTNNNNIINDDTSNGNKKEELPSSSQQQIDESYQGQGATNNSIVPNGGYSTTTTTTTTNPDYKSSSNSNSDSSYQGEGLMNSNSNNSSSTTTTTTTTN